jgi:hypothetical protein
MNYKVGQIFYLVGSETARVIPFRIIEEVTRTTLDGVEKSFIAELPDEKRTSVDVEKLKGVVFSSVNELRHHMLENASTAIENMIAVAEKLSSETFSELPDPDPNLAYSEVAEPEGLKEPANFEVLEKNENVLLNSEDVEDENTLDEERVQAGGEQDIVKVDIGNGVFANMKKSDLNKVSQI